LGISDTLVKISQYLPEITKPEKEITFKNKLLWTALALVIFFVLGKIALIGVDVAAGYGQNLGFAQVILASQMGTLITAGIGPIVMASIFLQLLLGAKLLNIELGSPEGRAKFQALQKILTVILCFVEGAVYVNPNMLVPFGGATPFNPWYWLVILQIAAGSIALLYLDEIVSKYGIGSGVSLFIAAGVSGELLWRVFLPPILPNVTSSGLLWATLTTGDIGYMFPFFAAIGILLIVTFAEGMHVNIPITMGHRGTGGRYPVKFLYVSNMPVILAMALFATLQLWATFLSNIPIIGTLANGLKWAVSMPNVGGMSIVQAIYYQGLNSITLAALAQGIMFLGILVVACIIFGWFWVQMGNQSTSAVAAQLERAGMQIPGFRRDKRVIEKVLSRYIPPITILGSIFVALLAGMGDFVLSGIASGTGILLTVGIVYRFYEEIAKSQADMLSSFLGKL